MTTWGFVADVHGNLPALRTAVDMLESAGATKLAFLGDYLGRGDSDGCVELIRRVATVAVHGNRDIDWKDRVGEETARWVLALPRLAKIEEEELLIAHGDQRLTPGLSTAEVPRGFSRALGYMEAQGVRILAFGHSHNARVWRAEDGANAQCELVGNEELTLRAGWRYLVNVGTTGLPFPGKGGPNVTLIDFTRGLLRTLPIPRFSGGGS